MTRPTIPLTAAEWASVQPDGTLWLAWEGPGDDPIHPEGIWSCEGCGRTYPEYINGCVNDHGSPRGVRLAVPEGPLPPAVFVQACAPCETCHNRCSVRRYSPPDGGGYGVADCTEDPCPDCRIELVLDGPCPTCNGAGYEENPAGGHLIEYLACHDCLGEQTITLGSAYAIGQPLPIASFAAWFRGQTRKAEPVGVYLKSGHLYVRDGKGSATNITAAFAHYGPPETLFGRWAIQLRVTP